jgi:protein SCO1/2
MKRIALAASCVLLWGSIAPAQRTSEPESLKKVSFDQNLGAQVDGDLRFTNSDGERIKLSDCFGGGPIVLTMAYYECPMLCKMTLDGVVKAFQELPFEAGRDYQWIVASIDPDETPGQASTKKATMEARYAHGGTGSGWHYLVGDEEAIRSLSDTVGFNYSYDEETGQYAHPAGVMVLTADGRVSKYFFGTDYDRDDLRLGLVDASGGTIGSVKDQVLLRCYQYDPSTGQYGFAVMAAVRAGGVLTVLAMAGLIGWLLWREKRRRKKQAA